MYRVDGGGVGLKTATPMGFLIVKSGTLTHIFMTPSQCSTESCHFGRKVTTLQYKRHYSEIRFVFFGFSFLRGISPVWCVMISV